MTTNDPTLKLLSIAQRQDILSRIALGEMTLVKLTREGSIEETPDFAERRAAIIELNKMDERNGEGEVEVPIIIRPGGMDKEQEGN